jgi:RNA polymerase sigma-70 factor (ECF subfamily)
MHAKAWLVSVSSSNAIERLIAAGLSLGKPNAKSPRSETRDPVWKEDDESIMHLVQRGEREALGLLFDRYSRLILNVATRILRDATEAQDVVQDVFLYVHRKSEIFDPNKGSVSSWLIQITYSRAINRRHRLNARAQADCSRIEDLADLADVHLSLERVADTLTIRGLVEQALKEVTERQRQTLRMYFFEGYSLREISTHLNENFANTRHHYYRGVEKLRAMLKDSVVHDKKEGVA